MNEAFVKWLMSPDVAAMSFTQREIMVARLAWAEATIASNKDTIERLQVVLDKSAPRIAA